MKYGAFLFGLILLAIAARASLAQELVDLETEAIVPWHVAKLTLVDEKRQQIKRQGIIIAEGPKRKQFIVEVFSEETIRVPYITNAGPEHVFHFWKKVEKNRRFSVPPLMVQFSRISTGQKMDFEQVVAGLKQGVPVFFKNLSQEIHPKFLKAIKKSAILVEYKK